MTSKTFRPNAVMRLAGGALMAVGGLITVLSGLCSAAFAGVSLFAGGGFSGFLQGLPLILIFGCIPIGVGILIFLGGRRLYRNHDPARNASNF